MRKRLKMRCFVDPDGSKVEVKLRVNDRERVLRIYVEEGEAAVVNLDHGRLVILPEALNEVRIKAGKLLP